MSNYVHSVAKAAQILYVFDEETRMLTVREIATRTGIPRSTVHETIRTLVANGLLENCPEGGVQLGAGLAMLGGHVVARQGLVDRALRPIRRHLEVFGIEVHVAGYTKDAVYYAHRQIGKTNVSVMNRTGRRWPVYATGCGRAILASMDSARRESLLPNEFTAVDRQKLEDETLRFERTGYLVTDVSERRIVSVAAPVYGARGDVVGAIGCGDYYEAMSQSRVDKIGQAVKAAARETSKLLWAPLDELKSVQSA